MNSHCGICDVEEQCGYEYKPCDCCNYRKFKPKPAESATKKKLPCIILEFVPRKQEKQRDQ